MQEPTDAAYLREQANLCRRLADRIADEATIAALRKMAEQFDAQAAQAESLKETAMGASLPPIDIPLALRRRPGL